MDLQPTDEQQQIIDSAANFLASEFPVDSSLAGDHSTTRVTRNQLQQIAGLGWIGIGLSDEFDGIGYGLSEEALLFVELGRYLMPPSLLASVLAARLAAQTDARTLLHPILEGQKKVTLAVARNTRSASVNDTVDGDFLLYEAADADLVLIADEFGAALLELNSLPMGEPQTCIDPGLQLTSFEAVALVPLCYLPASQDAIFLRGSLLTAALLLGIAEATLDRSVDYAKQREQFGKPIGSFQAIKHPCADMAIRCESIRAMLYHASITVQSESPAGLFDCVALKALANTGAQANANAAVQIHGGMGFTQEMDLHLFVKRAQVLGSLFGSERYQLKRLLHESRPD